MPTEDMPNKKLKKDILLLEKDTLLTYMRQNRDIVLPSEICRVKNALDSTKFRQRGNALYKNINLHDERVHEKIWKLYSQSIALSPNNSEELAVGYGNRSALFYHLKMYEESITDCNRAIHVTHSTVLKVKFLCRKAKCLTALKEPAAKSVASEALKLIDQNPLDFSSDFVLKSTLDEIINCPKMAKSKKSGKENYYKEFEKFPRQEEAPCASQSIKIKYNEQWGRHIVAEKDIKPGEIILIDNICYTFITCDGMYLFCSNCSQYTFSSIPCEHCIYDVYCSESCRNEAWTKYHQFECSLYPHFWDIDEDSFFTNIIQCSIKLVLNAVYQAGGIDQMRKQIEEIEYCQDPRVKGFTNGIFESSKIKSFYSLLSNEGNIKESHLKSLLLQNTCSVVYYLATVTNFFGKKLNILYSEMFLNEDIAFIAALLLHTHYLSPYNIFKVSAVYDESMAFHAKCVNPFYSLLNHSCDPNVSSIIAKNNKIIMYAKHPISKGSQLFSNYGMIFYNQPRMERLKYLETVYNFTCTCMPCTEKWSHISLPSFKQIAEVTPALLPEIEILNHALYNRLYMLEAHKLTDVEKLEYYPTLLRDMIYDLRKIARKITVHCSDYEEWSDIIHYLFLQIFGNYSFNMTKQCS